MKFWCSLHKAEVREITVICKVKTTRKFFFSDEFINSGEVTFKNYSKSIPQTFIKLTQFSCQENIKKIYIYIYFISRQDKAIQGKTKILHADSVQAYNKNR
jgi:hypothetical protein